MAFTTYTAQLTKWKDALDALAERGVASYSIGGRNLTSFDLPEIRNTIEWLERKVAQESRSNRMTTGVASFRKPGQSAFSQGVDR